MVSGLEELSREELLALFSAQARTIEALTATVETLTARVSVLEAQNAELKAENAELKRRLARNSRNSSQPPSADGPEQGVPPRSLRGKTGRKPGKQAGDRGFTLTLVENPDVVVDHVPDACGGCGAGLDTAMLVGVVRRQVTDVPAVSVTVTEHRLQRRRCACGCVTGAAAPGGVAEAPASYGPNLRAWVVYALVFQHIPVARVAELIRDLCGATPSTGWICGVLRQTATALAEVEELIRALLTAAHILHVDETGAKVTGARWWLHVAATDTLTSYHLDRSRGRVAIEEFGVLAGFTGTRPVHDAWASYNGYPGCEHAFCGAHIARELVAAGESHPEQHWPHQALDALFGLNTAAHDTRDQRQPTIPPPIADPLLYAWRHAILVGLAENPLRPGRKQSKTRNLLERLRDREDLVLRFTRNLSVPFTNNQAERDLRPTKTQMKISANLPIRNQRQSLGPSPRLRLHRTQTRAHRIRSDTRSCHRKPLDTNTFTHHLNSYDPEKEAEESISIRVSRDRFVLAYYLPFLRAIELDRQELHDSLESATFANLGIRISLPHVLADRIRAAEAGDLDGLADDVRVLIDDVASLEFGVFPDGSVVEANWQDALGLGDWGSFEG